MLTVAAVVKAAVKAVVKAMVLENNRYRMVHCSNWSHMAVVVGMDEDKDNQHMGDRTNCTRDTGNMDRVASIAFAIHLNRNEKWK